MAAGCGLTVIKRFNYRGDTTEEWSNHYWFSGAAPTSSVAWSTLFHEFADLEKPCYLPDTEIVAGYGYDNTDQGAHSVWSIDLDVTGPAIPGTLVMGTDRQMSGDQAGMLQWKTERKSSRGKWIYLRKYFHGGTTAGGDYDRCSPAMLAALNVLGSTLMDGSWPAGRTIQSARGPEVLQSHAPSEFVTTRTLRRRGKRPS